MVRSRLIVSAQRKVVLDVVAVAATVLLLHHVAGFGEVHDDAVRGALGDVERGGDDPVDERRDRGR